MVEGKKGTKVIKSWESGFGVEKGDIWIPIERLKYKPVYELIIEKRNRIKKFTPNLVRAVIYKIDK